MVIRRESAVPNAKFFAWSAITALAVVLAYQRYAGGGGSARPASVRRMGA
jgi:hypothetical protein